MRNRQEGDPSLEKARALAEFAGVSSEARSSEEMGEALLSLAEGGDADALAFLRTNSEACEAAYGKERVRSIIAKTREGVENAADGDPERNADTDDGDSDRAERLTNVRTRTE